MEVTLVKVKRTPRISKTSGKAYVSLGIMTNVHQERWLSGFDNKDTAAWKEGDTVQIDVEEKGEYLNFKPAGVGRAPAATETAKIDSRAVNMLTFEVLPKLDKILAWQDRRDVLDGVEPEKKESKVPSYGEMPEPNFDAASPF